MTVYFADCSPEDALRHTGTLVIPYEKVNSKGTLTKSTHKVYLNVVYTDDELTLLEDFLTTPNGAAAITVVKLSVLRGITLPAERQGTVFLRVDYDDVENWDDLFSNLPEGVIVLADLTCVDRFDIRDLVNLCSRYANLRFIGGSLLRVDGLRIGYFDKDALPGIGDGPKTVCNGVYDSFESVNFGDLEGVIERGSSRKGTATIKKSTRKPRVNFVDMTDSLDDEKKTSKKSPRVPKKLSRSDALSTMLGVKTVAF